MSKCKFIKSDKTRCNAEAIKQDDYCFWHSEKTREKRGKAVIEGGLSPKRNYGREDEIKIAKASDVLQLIEQTINDLRRNKTSTRIANATGYLAGIALKVIELNPNENVTETDNSSLGNKEFENEEDLIAQIQKSLDAITGEGKYIIRQAKGDRKKRREIGTDLTMNGSERNHKRVEPKEKNK